MDYQKRKLVTLSIWGRFYAVVTPSTNQATPKFDWANALADAGIMSGLSFFGALGGISAVGVPTVPALCGAGITALFDFFLFLALKRGLVKPSA